MASGIINLTRAFNQQEGMTKKEDKLPRRFFREVLGDTGKTIQPQDLKVMLKEYYELRGWSGKKNPNFKRDKSKA